MYTLIVLLSFLSTLNAHASFCFDSAFANRTDLSTCVIKGKQNIGCDSSGLNAEYLYVRMSCDGSSEYDLPVGKSTHGTQHTLEDTIEVLDPNATVNCVTTEGEEVSSLCPGSVMNYSYIVCDVVHANGRNLPEFTQDRICHGSSGHIISNLGLFFGIVLLSILI